MDTNDLSRETYTAIIHSAEIFHHDLTLHFGVLAEYCDTDNEFLQQSELLIRKWLNAGNLEAVKMDIFFDDPPGKRDFKKKILIEFCQTLKKLEIFQWRKENLIFGKMV